HPAHRVQRRLGVRRSRLLMAHPSAPRRPQRGRRSPLVVPPCPERDRRGEWARSEARLPDPRPPFGIGERLAPVPPAPALRDRSGPRAPRRRLVGRAAARLALGPVLPRAARLTWLPLAPRARRGRARGPPRSVRP